MALKDSDPSRAIRRIEHERFAQARADGEDLFDAYRKAGYSGERPAAHALSKRPHIAARIEWLMQEKRERALKRADKLTAAIQNEVGGPITLDSLVKEAFENMCLARAAGEIGESNKAIELIAKLMGFDLSGGKKTGKDANKGLIPRDGADQSRQISVQILNQITDRMGRPTGEDDQDAEDSAPSRPVRPISALSDERALRTVVRIEPPPGDDAGPVPVPVEDTSAG